MDQIERKQNMDKEMQETIKALRQAKKHLPEGDMQNYAAMIQAKVRSYEEENKMGSHLTEAEIREAERLMVETGEIADPNTRQMA